MYLRSTGTCGVQEICGLYGDKPTDIMLQFCKSLFEPPSANSRYRTSGNTYDHRDGVPFCFYLFTAGDQSGRPYGRNFAKFIKTEKLGIVVQAPEAKNHLFHPDHNNQAWLWTPDAKSLKKWYKANKEGKKISAGDGDGPDDDDGY